MTYFHASCKNFDFKNCRILILKSIPLMRNPLLTQIVTKDPNSHTYSNSHSYFDFMKIWLFASSRVSIIGDKFNRIIIRFRLNFLTLKNVSWVFLPLNFSLKARFLLWEYQNNIISNIIYLPCKYYWNLRKTNKNLFESITIRLLKLSI